MSSDHRFRRAGPHDAEAIAALTTGLTRRWIAPDCDTAGALALLASMTPEATAERLAGGYRYHVAESGAGRLLGVVAIREPQHLYHLFVDDAAQRGGLARALWNLARNDLFATNGALPITVNASRLAVPVYRRLGFAAEGAEQINGGIPSTPMRWFPPVAVPPLPL